jgi:hypothetical protein
MPCSPVIRAPSRKTSPPTPIRVWPGAVGAEAREGAGVDLVAGVDRVDEGDREAGAGRAATTGLGSRAGRGGASAGLLSSTGAGAGAGAATAAAGAGASAGGGSGAAGAGSGAGAGWEAFAVFAVFAFDVFFEALVLDDFLDDLGAASTAGAASTSSAERTPQQTRGSGWNMLRERGESGTGDSGSRDSVCGNLLQKNPSSRDPSGRGRRDYVRGLSRGGGGAGLRRRRPARTSAPAHPRWRSNHPRAPRAPDWFRPER